VHGLGFGLVGLALSQETNDTGMPVRDTYLDSFRRRKVVPRSFVGATHSIRRCALRSTCWRLRTFRHGATTSQAAAQGQIPVMAASPRSPRGAWTVLASHFSTQSSWFLALCESTAAGSRFPSAVP